MSRWEASCSFLLARRSSPRSAHHRAVVLPGVVGLLLACSGAVSPVDAAGWEVCSHGCRYDQVGPALAAARKGDTIRVGPGLYAGGLTITIRAETRHQRCREDC